MAINSDPRSPYREQWRNPLSEPRRSFADNASASWIIAAAAIAAVLLFWFFSTSSSTNSVDTTAVPVHTLPAAPQTPEHTLPPPPTP